MLCAAFLFSKTVCKHVHALTKSHDNFLNGHGHCKLHELCKWLQPLNVTRLHQKEPGYEARVWDQESTSPNRMIADMEVNSKFTFKNHGT